MSFILTANLIFGIMFVIRTTKQSAQDPLIVCDFLAKIGTVFICSQIFVAFFLFHHQIFAICCINLINLAIFLFTNVLRWRSKQALNQEFFIFVQDLVMNLKLGFAFMKSSQIALDERSAMFRSVMKHLLRAQSIYIGQVQRHLFLNTRALEELRSAEQMPHTALKRLSALRDEQQLLSEFRRRSGQATAQARIQSSILWVLLFAMGMGVVMQFGLQKTWQHLGVAVLLFIAGQLVFNRIIRKTKWSV